MARAHAIDPLSQSRVEVVVFIVVSFRFVLVIGLLKAAALRRLTLEITGPRKRAKPAVTGPVHRRVGRHLPTCAATYLAGSCRFFRPS